MESVGNYRVFLARSEIIIASVNIWFLGGTCPPMLPLSGEPSPVPDLSANFNRSILPGQTRVLCVSCCFYS